MIWAGQGILYAGATAELTQVAELLAAPVMTTILGKSGFDETHPLALGTGGFSCTDMVTDYLKRCDTLFAVGASLSRNFTAPRIPRGKTLVHATVDPTDLNASFPAHVAIMGDAKLVLLQMIEEIQKQTGSGVSTRRANICARAKRAGVSRWWRVK